jgi:hypothetical protein
MATKQINTSFNNQTRVFQLNLTPGTFGNPGTITDSLLHTFPLDISNYQSDVISIQKTTTGKYLAILRIQPVFSPSNPVINYTIVQYSALFAQQYSLIVPSPIEVNPYLITYNDGLYFTTSSNQIYEITYSSGNFSYTLTQTSPVIIDSAFQNGECLTVDFNTVIQNAPTPTPTLTRTPTPTPTRQVGQPRRIWDYGPEGRNDGCRCNALFQICESINLDGGNMTLLTVYMFPGETPCTIGAFMYTDDTLTTKFVPNGINNSYRPTFVCIGQISAISSNCFRQDTQLGIQFVC